MAGGCEGRVYVYIPEREVLEAARRLAGELYGEVDLEHEDYTLNPSGFVLVFRARVYGESEAEGEARMRVKLVTECSEGGED